VTDRDRIPFLDLVTPHAELRAELTSVVTRALDTAGFIGGPMVETFERDFAAFCGVGHCVGVGSGTEALLFALVATGVPRGSVVVTVPHTFIATTEAISQAGAVPEFVDVDPRTGNMDMTRLAAWVAEACDVDADGRLTSRKHGRPVAAVIPVHLHGRMVDMDPLMALAARHHLAVIEDACQAHGAEYWSEAGQAWRRAGSMGHAAAFSFYPGKNLGACGEAGAVTTSDESVAARIRRLRDHGQSRKYVHEVEGFNGRLDAVQAGWLSVKLAHLHAWNQARRACAAHYDAAFDSRFDQATGVVRPWEPAWSRAVYHIYAIRVPGRDALITHLSQAGIGSGIHYPVPLHVQPAYRHLGYEAGDFPEAEAAAAETVSLPMFPTLTSAQQDRVVATIAEWRAGR